MAYIAIWRAKESVNCEAEEQSQKTAHQGSSLGTELWVSSSDISTDLDKYTQPYTAI